MKGLVALVGAGEYLPVMDEVDRYLLDSVQVDGRAPRVVCLPTAAGREGDESVGRWSRMGVEHFQRLGADVQAVPVIDKESAGEPRWASAVENADLIYFSGGDPFYLYETMRGSLVWAAAQKAWERGAVYAGCSAGAMILGKRLPNFRQLGMSLMDGFGLVPADYIMPHFDRSGPLKPFVNLLRGRLKDGQVMIGVDENTALVGKLDGGWRVMGKSKVHVMTRKSATAYSAGEVVPF